MQRCEKLSSASLLLKRMHSSAPVNDMLNKHQIEPLALHYICNGSGANVPLLFPLVKEKSSRFLLAP